LSSERIRDRVSGTQVALQFSSINEGGYIRTTPTPSPRSSRSLTSYYEAARSGSPSSNAPSTPPASSTEAEPLSSDEEPEDSSATPTTASPAKAVAKKSLVLKENRRAATRPPPILKKSSSGSSESSSSTQDQNTKSGAAAGDEEAVVLDEEESLASRDIPMIKRTAPSRRSTTTRFNEEVAVSIPKVSTSMPRSTGDKPRRSSGDSTGCQRSGKRNPVVVASTGASRRKPAVLPRRPSGTSSLGNSRTSSYSKLARSPKASTIDPSSSSNREPAVLSKRLARAASPHPSKQRRRLSPGPPSDEEDSDEDETDDDETEAQQPTLKATSASSGDTSEDSSDDKAEAAKPLVDPNFRSQFVDRSRPQRSLTNLHAFARKSSASTPTAASFQATGMIGSGQATSSAGRGKGREAFTNVTAPLKAPASTGPEPAADDARPLPKTESQLTLLLEREQARSGQEHSSKKPDKP
jgi:hypothetical protein